MTDTQDVLQLLANAGSHLYWDEDGYDDDVVLDLSDTDFLGLALGTPGKVALDKNPEFPAIVLRKTTGQRDWEVEFRINSRLVAVHLDSGSVFTVYAFATNKRYDPSKIPRSMRGNPPDQVNAESESTDMYRFFLFRMFRLPLVTGRFAVTFLNYELRSNTALIELEGGELSSEQMLRPMTDDEVVAVARETESSIRSHGSRPAPLADRGITLTSPTQVRADEEIPISGSIRDVLPTHSPIFDLGDGSPLGGADDDASSHPLRALHRARLMALRKDELYPPQVDVLAPVFLQQEPSRDSEVEGVFSFDLGAKLSEPLVPGEYLLYLFAGELIEGPIPLQVTP